MQQTCLFYRGRELQAQRGEQQTHVWKGCCSNCTAVYSFFNVLCLRHDLALNIVIMILKKKYIYIFLTGGCRGQKTIYRNWFSPYTTWVRGIRVALFDSSRLYPLRCLTGHSPGKVYLSTQFCIPEGTFSSHLTCLAKNHSRALLTC